ncbi:MAG: hypothetical protein NTX16_07145 [Actinobacteria bacterium]|nr:hypothetical protein [Actinomycetota bacterium]
MKELAGTVLAHADRRRALPEPEDGAEHISAIYRKLSVGSRSEAIMKGMELQRRPRFLAEKEAGSAGPGADAEGLADRLHQTTRQTLPPASRHEEAPYLSRFTLLALPGRPGRVRRRAAQPLARRSPRARAA